MNRDLKVDQVASPASTAVAPPKPQAPARQSCSACCSAISKNATAEPAPNPAPRSASGRATAPRPQAKAKLKCPKPLKPEAGPSRSSTTSSAHEEPQRH